MTDPFVSGTNYILGAIRRAGWGRFVDPHEGGAHSSPSLIAKDSRILLIILNYQESLY
ncbi:MAG TPA: hypothetical protein VED24_03640 [Candidatus Acidoferrum sp.]|nr:hypothetical protein [Candidatus Acidoferrum sp.]